MVQAIEQNPDALGYVPLTSSGPNLTALDLVPFDAVGQSNETGPGTLEGGVEPTLGRAGTVAAAIERDEGTLARYEGWLPIEWVDIYPPVRWTGGILGFVMDRSMNPAIATAAGDVSVYELGATSVPASSPDLLP